MTGRSIEYVFPAARRRRPPATSVLEVDGLAPAGEFADVSFTVRAGEVVGLAGLVGSGRSEILETVYGARRATAGTVRVRGRDAAGRARCRRRCGPGWGCAPRSARARACCWPSRCTATCRCPRCAGSPGPGSCGRRRRAGRGRRGHRAARRAPARPDAPGAHAVRRQPAEGRAGPLAAAGLRRAAARRAHPRRRRRRAQRDLRADPQARRPRAWPCVLVSSEVPEVLGLADRVLVVREGRVVHEAPGGRARRGPGARPGDGGSRQTARDVT